LAPIEQAIQAMRGVRVIVAVTVAAEVGDFTGFSNPRQLMACLGLVPSEHSYGSRSGAASRGNEGRRPATRLRY
jgi:transposase